MDAIIAGHAATEAQERMAEEAYDQDMFATDWHTDSQGRDYATESDFGTDYDGTDWEEHYAWQAHETFAEFHPEDRA